MGAIYSGLSGGGPTATLLGTFGGSRKQKGRDQMIGGYYILAIEPSEADAETPEQGENPKELTTLVAGPFDNYRDADKMVPAAVAYVHRNYEHAARLKWGVCEFWFHRLVLGTRNAELWATPTPAQKRA